MKVLIWLGCIFGYSILMVTLSNSGIMLGGLPTALLFAGMIGIAGRLCRNLDKDKESFKSDDVSQNEVKPRATEYNFYCTSCHKPVTGWYKKCPLCGSENTIERIPPNLL